ncbi:MAG: glycosyltransferase family 2 protein [Planctomycetia bacterium]|nr:glycosyltransferase family 2 protein [Planctomycetia bacterium]
MSQPTVINPALTNPAVTIIMPALNEERNITGAMRDTLGAFDELNIAGELIVVNDGSTDGTARIVNEEIARDGRVRLVSHDNPHGVGASFWDGVGHARGEFVCMLPGDNENEPRETLRYLPVLEHVDIVVPFVFNRAARSAYRNAISFAYQYIINLTFLSHFNYTNGTVIYRTRILDEIETHNSGFFYQTDILVRLVKRGYLFAEVPYRLKQRAHGDSTAVSFASLMKVMRGYLRLVKDHYLTFRKPDKRPYVPESQTAKRYNELRAKAE